MTRSFVILLCLGVAVLAVPAQAQNPQPASPGVTPAPMAPPNSPSPPPEQIAPAGKDVHADGQQTLSDKLALQHGMVDPPHGIDPGMTVHPPAQSQGTMPVIPPPGSPGGNAQVVPK